MIKTAFSAGAKGINFAGDPIILQALKTMFEEGYTDAYGVYPMVPNTQLYVSAIGEKGIAGLARDVLGNLDWSGKAKTLIRGGLSVIRADPFRAMKVFLDIDINSLLETLP
ncbi:MAG: hypothetical protein M1368_05245, partial [Thaumarchaeota archaeon]|nr:hypothetical protein [Nitrososphaerota archaeon]